MGFNEKVHAYIAAKYYVYLKDEFGDRGERAFLHATQYYALQRGRRMAQRAIRDGKELTQETYNYYGEWVNTEDVKSLGQGNKMTQREDGAMVVTSCPWNAQFKEMGLLDAGAAYCKDLDASISRGFNPALGYQVDQTLNTSSCCIHRLLTGDICVGASKGKNPEGLKDFEYHCAHSYWAYNEVTRAIFETEGEIINKEVISDFENEYGKEMADAIRKYKDTNFNVC